MNPYAIICRPYGTLRLPLRPHPCNPYNPCSKNPSASPTSIRAIRAIRVRKTHLRSQPPSVPSVPSVFEKKTICVPNPHPCHPCHPCSKKTSASPTPIRVIRIIRVQKNYLRPQPPSVPSVPSVFEKPIRIPANHPRLRQSPFNLLNVNGFSCFFLLHSRNLRNFAPIGGGILRYAHPRSVSHGRPGTGITSSRGRRLSEIDSHFFLVHLVFKRIMNFSHLWVDG